MKKIFLIFLSTLFVSTLSYSQETSPNLENLPDIKLFLDEGFNPAFDLEDFNTGGTVSNYSIHNNFLGLSTITGSQVYLEDYAFVTTGSNSYIAQNATGSSTSSHKIKFSTYKIQKLPKIGLRPGSSEEINIFNYTLDNSSSGTPNTYGNNNSIINSNPGNIQALWTSNSTVLLTALSGFTSGNPVSIDIIASPVSESSYDTDKERIWIYPNLLLNSSFSTSNDTTFYGYELAPPTNKLVKLPVMLYQTIASDEFGNIANGVISFLFTDASTGVKSTPVSTNRIPFEQDKWYTARMRITSNTGNSHQTLLFNFSNEIPGSDHVDVAGSVLFGTPSTWTWLETPLYSHETGLGYPQFQLKAGGAGYIYLDELQIIQSIPTLIDAKRGNIKYKYPGGDFDSSSDIQLWGKEGYEIAGGITSNPIYSVLTGKLRLDFTGAGSGTSQKGIKWTASSTASFAGLVTPSNTRGRQIGIKATLNKVSGNFNTFESVILLGAYGIQSSGQTVLGLIPGDLFSSAEFGRINNGIHYLVGTAVNELHQFQFGTKTNLNGILELDDIDFLLDSDDPNYGEDILFP